MAEELTIRISAKNLSQKAFKEAVRDVAGLGGASDTTTSKTKNLEKAVRSSGNSAKASGTSFKTLLKSHLSAAAIIGAARTAFRKLTQVIGGSVAAMARQEAAIKSMEAALKAQGADVPRLSSQYQKLASQFQQTTVFGDELLLEMQALFISVGDVGPDQMEKALTAATDLSAGIGKDLRTSVDLVAKAFAGETSVLKRYGIIVDEAALKSRGIDAVLEEINNKMGGAAQAQIDTYTGRTKQLGNAWGDFKETLGSFITENAIVNDSLVRAKKEIEDWTVFTNRHKTALEQQTVEMERNTKIAELMRIEVQKDIDAQREIRDWQLLRGVAVEKLNAITRLEQEAEAALVVELKAVKDAEIAALKAAEQAEKDRQAHIKTIQALATSLSGAGLRQQLADIEEAWGTLSAEERANEDVKGRVAAAVGTLSVTTGQLSGELRRLLIEWNKQNLEALPAFEEGTRENQEALGAMIGSLALSNQGLQQFEGDLDTGTESLGDMIGSLPVVTGMTGDLQSTIEQGGGVAKSFWNELAGGKVGPKGVLSGLKKVFSGVGGGFSEIMTGAFQGIGASLVPVIGSLIGTLAGKLFGGLKRLFGGKSTEQRIREEVRRSWGVAISEGLSKAIAAQSKTIGSRTRAILVNQAAIWEEAGGVMAFGLDKAIKATDQLLRQMGRGGHAATEVGAAFTQQFGLIAAQAIDKATGIADKGLVTLIQRSKQIGIESANVSAFILEQAQQGSLALSSFIKSSTSETVEGARLAATGSLALFKEAVKGGQNVGEVLRGLGPDLAVIGTRMREMGVTVPQGFNRIALAAQAVTDEVTGPMIQAAEDASAILVSLANVGTENLGGSFADMGVVVRRSFEDLIAGGADSETAFLALRGPLATLIALQKEYGFQVDESTQALIQQAIAGGVTEDATKTALERQIESMDRMAAALERLEELQRRMFEEQFDHPFGFAPFGGFHEGEEMSFAQHGGLFSRPSTARIAETGPEMVGSPDVMARALSQALTRHFPGGGAGSGEINILIADGKARTLGRAEFRQIAAAFQGAQIRVPSRGVGDRIG